jgi:hypothetical protein
MTEHIDQPGDIEITSISGYPTDEEQAAIRVALADIIEREHRARAASIWRRASRSQGRRLGMSDYRDRFEVADAWRLSTRFPFGGREYQGLNGRGDAK